jgi:hypothetical protein
MFYTTLKIINPYSDRFKIVFNCHGKLIKNKAWEFEILKVDSIINITIEFTSRTDHAGLRFEFGLFGYELGFTIYDVRHWNHINNCWRT